MSNDPSHDDVRALVREHDGQIARNTDRGGCAPGCCSPTDSADLGLGCGNPTAIAALAAPWDRGW